MTITRFWWVRHAPAINNGGLIYGGAEIDADTSAVEVFAGLAAALPRDAVFLASGLARTHQTLAAVRAAGHPGVPDPVAGDPRLNEQSLGDWHGMPIREIFPTGGPWPGFWMLDAARRAPNGESFTDLTQRVAPAVIDIRDRHAGRDIVIAAHGGTIRAALGQALALAPAAALAFSIDNCSITRIDHIEGKSGAAAWRVAGVNHCPRAL